MELELEYVLFFLISVLIIYVLTNYFKNKCESENFQNNNDNCENEIYNKPVEGKKLFNLDDKQWGWVAVATNGISVIFQLYSLFKTKSAQSFDITFITLMTILNATYALLGLLIMNWGLFIATLIFVFYNLTVMFFYYSGKKK